MSQRAIFLKARWAPCWPCWPSFDVSRFPVTRFNARRTLNHGGPAQWDDCEIGSRGPSAEGFGGTELTVVKAKSVGPFWDPYFLLIYSDGFADTEFQAQRGKLQDTTRDLEAKLTSAVAAREDINVCYPATGTIFTKCGIRVFYIVFFLWCFLQNSMLIRYRTRRKQTCHNVLLQSSERRSPLSKTSCTQHRHGAGGRKRKKDREILTNPIKTFYGLRVTMKKLNMSSFLSIDQFSLLSKRIPRGIPKTKSISSTSFRSRRGQRRKIQDDRFSASSSYIIMT